MGDDLTTYLRDLASSAPASPGAENRLVVSEVDSTNRLARSVVSLFAEEEMPPPSLLVLALAQSAGRGRQGRHWVSPAGGGVYGTRVLSVGRKEDLKTVPLLAASGLARGVDELLGSGRDDRLHCGLEWPNDLVIGGRKVGGVLVETVAEGAGGATALIGFGINYRPVEDARGGRLAGTVPGATTLADEVADDLPPLGRVAATVVDGLEKALAHVGDSSHAIETFRALTVHDPGDRLRFRIGGEEITGDLLGFDDRGHIRLRVETGGERVISSGEIVETIES